MTSKPRFFGSPLVTWDPASGAVAYQVQWSRSNVPVAAGRLGAHGGHVGVLPLTPGVLVVPRPRDQPLAAGSQLMTWSTPVPIVITQPTFSVTATPAPAKRG